MQLVLARGGGVVGDPWPPITRPIVVVAVIVIVIMQNPLKSLACVGAQGHKAHNALHCGWADEERERKGGGSHQDIDSQQNGMQHSEKRSSRLSLQLGNLQFVRCGHSKELLHEPAPLSAIIHRHILRP